jgi:rare lipoprotein A
VIPLFALALALAGCAGNTPRAPVSSQSVINPTRSDRGNPPFYEVFGERYHVLDSSDGFRENGVASWYGRDFHGKPTSSGEPYDMYEMTAAHKTLPIPTWVEVTNVENGKQVIVKVNDRGPFVDGRVIDLSLRAAEQLDMVRNGTARVRVRALGAPATAPSPVLVSSPPPAPAPQRGFSIVSEARADTVTADAAPFRPIYVQVGAFSDRNNATRLAERLRDEGIGKSFVLTSGEGRDRIHRVRVGPIADANEFDRMRQDLRAAGVGDARLVRDN